MRIVVVVVFLATVALASSEISSNDLNFAEMLQDKGKDVEKKAERLNRNFQRMLQLVNILGQVDNFLTERVKLLLRKLALLAEDDVSYAKRRRS
ncbi:hypothetical protein FQR65_LT12569 [Abscondita terminalis]|nr:hypothetical protein FQR65_LT12569 [Abscondita terminalis]